jgi:hypothetical protein
MPPHEFRDRASLAAPPRRTACRSPSLSARLEVPGRWFQSCVCNGSRTGYGPSSAHQHLLDHAPIQWIDIGIAGTSAAGSPGRQPAHVGAAQPPSGRPARPRRSPCPRARRAVRQCGIPRPAERGPILFRHRLQDLQARSNGELEQLASRVNDHIDEPEVAGRSAIGTSRQARSVPCS